MSALPLGLAVVALWSPPSRLEGVALGGWFAIAVLLYYTAFTCFRVPHMAMGAELSRGYHDRSRVFGISEVVEKLGMLLGALSLLLLERSGDQRDFAGPLSIGIAVGMVILIWVSTSGLRERPEFQGRGGTSPRSSFGDVLSNPHSRLLIAIVFMELLGFQTVIVLLPYVSDYILETRGNTAIYAGSALAAMALSVPLWLAIVRRAGKQRTWFWSLVAKIPVLAWFFMLQKGDFGELIGMTILFGALTGAGAVAGPSLKADVVDWDEARTGERKEGTYFATWNFAQKAAAGVAIWIVGTTLALTGYIPNAQQTQEVLNGMRMLASSLPVALHAVAALLVFRFSLDEAAHRKARLEAESAKQLGRDVRSVEDA